MAQYKDIRFPNAPMADFFPTLRTRVGAYFSEQGLSKHGNWKLYSKTVFMFTLYFGSYALILSKLLPPWGDLLLCVCMGLGAVGLGMSVMHDALHNSYSSSKKLNNVLGKTMEILGGSSFTWKIQHNILHHTYTNVYGMDEDIDDKPFLRLSPDGKYRWIHRYQHYYAFLVYGLSLVSWIIVKDFKQLAQYYRSGLVKQVGANVWKEALIQICSKSLYVVLMIILPFWWLDYAWYWIVLGIAVVLVTTGTILTTVFLTAHAVEEPIHAQPDAEGNLENNWAIHQVQTTANFKTTRLFSWFIGGLNYQIEHHLFPHISHVHYPAISKIVRETTREYGLPYFMNRSFLAAVASHVRYLKKLGAPNTL